MKQVIEKDMTPITLAKGSHAKILESLQSLNRSAVVQMDLKFPLWGGFQHQISLPVAKICMVALNTLASKTMERAVDTIIGIVTKIRNKKDSDWLSGSFIVD